MVTGAIRGSHKYVYRLVKAPDDKVLYQPITPIAKQSDFREPQRTRELWTHECSVCTTCTSLGPPGLTPGSNPRSFSRIRQ